MMNENETVKDKDFPIGSGLVIAITPEMIEAGASALMEDDYLRPYLCQAFAEEFAESVLRQALGLDPI